MLTFECVSIKDTSRSFHARYLVLRYSFRALDLQPSNREARVLSLAARIFQTAPAGVARPSMGSISQA